MWNLFLLFKLYLLSILSPGVEGEGDDGAEDGTDDSSDDGSDDEGGAEDGADDEEEDPEPDDEPAPRQSRAQKEIISLRERAQKAEDDHRKAMTELDAARRGPAPAAQPSADQKLWDQEEAILNNPEATDWQRYAVQSNRTSRQAEANSRNALHQARDLSDKASFDRIATTNPKVHAAYKDKVESTLSAMRAKGNDAPREKLLALLVGEDMIAGKLKTAEARPAKPQGGAKRGSTPGARSDVSSSGSGKLTDAEKRAKRLENVRI